MALHQATHSPLQMEQKRLTTLLRGEVADELRELPPDTQNEVVSYLQTHLA